MLRVYFTSEDVARTVVCAEPDPLWEVLLSGFRLRERCPPLCFRPWLGALSEDRSRASATRCGNRVPRALAPNGPYFPDFLTPTAARQGLDDGLDRTGRASQKSKILATDRTFRDASVAIEAVRTHAADLE